jgi:hypothetical protein
MNKPIKIILGVLGSITLLILMYNRVGTGVYYQRGGWNEYTMLEYGGLVVIVILCLIAWVGKTLEKD